MEVSPFKALRAMIQCASIPDPDVSAHIVWVLLEKKEISVKDLTKELNVSYPLVLRVINDLTGLGIVTTSKLKVEGRGRPRKLVRINLQKLASLLDDCRKDLDEVQALVSSKANAPVATGQTS